MRYWILAGVSAFSAYALFAVAGSAAARLGASLLAPRAGRYGAVPRARLLFRLRILPALAAVVAAFAIALPVFLWFEEAGTAEPVSRTLALVACAGAWLLARGVWRAVDAWRSTGRVLADWRRRARVLDTLDVAMPAYAIEDPFPTVAVIGVFTPRLFVAERVMRECSAGEVAAMVSHECAHVSARDNLKRLLIRACPDVFGTPRRLDRAWAAAAEEAADARAAIGNPAVRLDLAQALIHVARLAVPQAPALASAFYLGGSIEDRVRRLVDPPAIAVRPRWTRLALPLALIALATTVVLTASSLHGLMEQAIRLLP